MKSIPKLIGSNMVAVAMLTVAAIGSVASRTDVTGGGCASRSITG